MRVKDKLRAELLASFCKLLEDHRDAVLNILQPRPGTDEAFCEGCGEPGAGANGLCPTCDAELRAHGTRPSEVLSATPAGEIMSIGWIIEMLQTQASLRSQENDEAGVLLQIADSLARDINALDEEERPSKRNADRIDGYDRDDLGESPDF